jgi:hypothetical protein
MSHIWTAGVQDKLNKLNEINLAGLSNSMMTQSTYSPSDDQNISWATRLKKLPVSDSG